MFEHYLPNKNERATVAPKSKFTQLNKGYRYFSSSEGILSNVFIKQLLPLQKSHTFQESRTGAVFSGEDQRRSPKRRTPRQWHHVAGAPICTPEDNVVLKDFKCTRILFIEI